MSIIGDLKKSGKKHGFVSHVEKLGFTLAPSAFWFYRWRGEFLDMIHVWPIASGTGIRVPVSTYIAELMDDVDIKDFPKGFANIGMLSDMTVGESSIELWPDDWDTESEKEREQTFRKLCISVEQFAIPWFDAIDTREKLWDSISERVRNGPASQRYFQAVFTTNTQSQ